MAYQVGDVSTERIRRFVLAHVAVSKGRRHDSLQHGQRWFGEEIRSKVVRRFIAVRPRQAGKEALFQLGVGAIDQAGDGGREPRLL